MTMVGKMVHPDTRKGLLYVYQAEDGLIHFCWKNRTTNKVEDDLIIFPDDCEFKRVEQCKTGRVYLLKVGVWSFSIKCIDFFHTFKTECKQIQFRSFVFGQFPVQINIATIVLLDARTKGGQR